MFCDCGKRSDSTLDIFYDLPIAGGCGRRHPTAGGVEYFLRLRRASRRLILGETAIVVMAGPTYQNYADAANETVRNLFFVFSKCCLLYCRDASNNTMVEVSVVCV